MEKRIEIPADAEYIIDKLEKNGYEAYVVGGCVRDCLMGIEPHDWDICTSATPKKVIELFCENKVLLTGLKHGTVTVIIDVKPFEITTYRIDGEYKNNRHPEKVEFVSDLKHDLMRRDFTINAMAYNHKDGLIDLFGGIDDINNKTIRCVGNPDKRFTEDALRMLRAVRFATKFNYTIENDTLCSLLNYKSLIKNISSERINSELSKILCYSNDINSRETTMILIELLKQIIPGIQKVNFEDIYNRITRSICSLEIRLAILFDFPNIEFILKTLKYSNDIVYNAKKIRDYGHKIFNDLWVQKNQYEYYSKTLLHDLGYSNSLKAVQFAISLTKENEDYSRFKLKELIYYINENYKHECVYNLSKLNVNGYDLIKLGYSGKDIGIILDKLLDLVMKKEITNNKEALLKTIEQIQI